VRRERGFTLLELLAAAALFSVLGVLLFQMVRSAMDVWGTGERNRELADRAGAAFELLATDLRDAWAGTPGAALPAALLCTWRPEDDDGDGEAERRIPLLRFTRLCHEQRTLEWLSRAGDTAGGQESVAGLQPRDPATLRPTGGLAESLYTLAERSGATLPALLRVVHAPAGGERSLLDPQLEAQRDRLLSDAVPAADDVLFFGVEFWGPGTHAWGPEGGAYTAWDSTRGLIPPGDPDFPFGVGPASRADSSDDIWPRLARLTLVLDRAQGATGSGTLAEAMGPESKIVTVADAAFLRDEEAPDHVLVDGEWLAVTGIEGRTLQVQRGARGTQAAVHNDGARVRTGRTFRRVVALPAGRELLVEGVVR
jgi:prepilin-type N-terminal cleavage/methylation domain-containing protein